MMRITLRPASIWGPSRLSALQVFWAAALNRATQRMIYGDVAPPNLPPVIIVGDHAYPLIGTPHDTPNPLAILWSNSTGPPR